MCHLAPFALSTMSFSPPIPRVAHRPYPSPQYLLVDPLFPTSKDLYRALGSDNDPLQPLAGLTLLALILSCPFYDLGLFAFGEDHTLGLALGFVDHDPHDFVGPAQAALELFAVFVDIDGGWER